MRKCDSYLSISGYKYAPEQFKAYRVTGFSNGNRNVPIYKCIDLTYDETRKCGSALACNGKEAARAVLKRILRERERKTERRCTIGFKEQGDGKRFAYIADNTARFYDLDGMLRAFKRVKRAIKQNGTWISEMQMATLDGHFKPESVKEIGYHVDMNRPIIIKERREAA